MRGPSPAPEFSPGFPQLTLDPACNLLFTCGSLGCHQDLLLSLPCSACWAPVLWDCALVLSTQPVLWSHSFWLAGPQRAALLMLLPDSKSQGAAWKNYYGWYFTP